MLRIPILQAVIRSSAVQTARELGVDLGPSESASIDWDALNAVVGQLIHQVGHITARRLGWMDDRFWLVDEEPEIRSQYLVIGNAINFRFWSGAGAQFSYCAGVREGEILRGSLYMWRSLRLAHAQFGSRILEAAFLERIGEAQFGELFSDDNGESPLDVGKDDRIRNLRDLGKQLRKDWKGRFSEVVRQSRGSLVEFARLSRGFRAFDDSLYKLTMVNAIMHSGSGIATFDRPPIPAIDYEILKQLLRQGVLVPHQGVAEKLTRRLPVAASEAHELRRVALHALLRMCDATGIGGDLIDNVYWGNRKLCDDLAPVCLDPATAQDCPFFGPCQQIVELLFPLENTRHY
jgi:hypothetical protein